jgi:hypothetical protein
MEEVRKCHAKCDPEPRKKSTKTKNTMATNLKVGDKVRVMDQGLLMLQKFAPPGAKPNNEGIVHEILEDGELEIWFPIGDDDPEKHSQASIYPANICHKIP